MEKRNMRYAQIRSLDLSNGEGIGIALFVQGCHLRCKNCFNPETWDFNGGKEWTEEVKNKFLELANRPFIKRVSILGGEPLAEENIDDVLDLVNRIRFSSQYKSIWLYTGYTWEYIFEQKCQYHPKAHKKSAIDRLKRQKIISQCDVLIDDRYLVSQRDISLNWRGSSNQRVISVKESLLSNKIILYCI